MYQRFIFVILLPIFSLNSCSEVSNKIKNYQVKKISSGSITLDGKGGDAVWANANVLTDFQYPWRNETPPQTAFRALWDDEFLYFLYRATDPDIITTVAGAGENDVVSSDRVEIFFKADDKMNPYYALEMDALGRVLDTEGRYHRNIDYKWNWPEGHLVVKAATDSEGYWVEGSVSLQSLKDLGMYDGGKTLRAGLYRGEYVPGPQGREVKWISWVKPDSETPDFHIPSSFGTLTLMP